MHRARTLVNKRSNSRRWSVRGLGLGLAVLAVLLPLGLCGAQFQADPAAQPTKPIHSASKGSSPERDAESAAKPAVKSGTSTSAKTAPDSSNPATQTQPKSFPSAAAGDHADNATERSKTATSSHSGLVWVNTASGVYHRPGSRWYGKTKKGKYMLEADAIRAGYKLAK